MWQESSIEPDSGVSYPQVLRNRHHSPARSLVGALLAFSGYLLIVPVTGRLLVELGWLLRGKPDHGSYLKAAVAYEVPEGLVAGHLALAMLIPISLLIYRYLHCAKPKWLASVQPGVRVRYLIGCVLVAAVVLNAVLWLTRIGSPSPFVGPQEDWVWFVLAILICTPLQASAEEVFFRGYLIQAIGAVSISKWVSVGFSALLFALMHGTQNLALFADRFVFGLLAGCLVVLTGGIEAGIAAHIVNNLGAFGYAVFSGGVAQVKAVQELTWAAAAADIAGFAAFGAVACWVSCKMKVATATP